jgi:integrase
MFVRQYDFPEHCNGGICLRYKLLKTGASADWHGLRHFPISTWIEAGLTPKTVQTFAGHASLHVTMDRYGHLFPSDDHRRAMDRIAHTLFTPRSGNAE